MSSFILFVIIGGLFYFLTRGFVKNPSYNRIDLERKQFFRGSIKDHEAGLLVALMAKVAKADGRVSELEAELITNTLKDISNSFENAQEVKEELKQIYRKEKDNFKNVLEVARKYHKLTKFSYKRRLILMEYLLNLAFIDGEFSPNERMICEDIAQALDINKRDFDSIVIKFENFYSQRSSQQDLSLQEAYEVLGANESDDFGAIKKKYRNLVRQNHPDILMGQGKSEDIIEQATKKLQKINEAYELIKKHKEG